MASNNLPIPQEQLNKFAEEAVQAAIGNADSYVHSSCPKWNAMVIDHILRNLVETTASGENASQYKFAVNSTIIQHSASGGAATRRGMHSASGAFWNNEKDCMWSWKSKGLENKGMDVVVSVMFISI